MFEKDNYTPKKPLDFSKRGAMPKPNLTSKLKKTHAPLDFSKRKPMPPPDLAKKYKKK